MILHGDTKEVMRKLIAEGVKVQTCVTSPPYWGLRNYGHEGQYGLEDTPEEYVNNMVEVFSLVREILKDDGTLWLNLGDSYSGSGKGGGGSFASERKGWEHCKPKDRSAKRWGGGNNVVESLPAKNLVGIPWRVAFALQADGWILRSDIIWAKPNPMPESVTDRPTKAHEYIFLLSKSPTYFYDNEAIKEPGVWDVDGNGTMQRKKRVQEGQKSNPSEMKNGIRKPIFRDPKKHNGKNSDKQRGHSRRHAGFNERWDKMSVKEQCSGMRNKRSVWTVTTKPYAEAHFAVYPPDLIEPCIMAGSKPGDIVLDPFNGSGTTGLVAYQNRREYIGIELNQDYIDLTNKRLKEIEVRMF